MEGLANPVDISEESSSINERVVLALYDALSTRDGDRVQKLLAPDLEWWFHGPPSHQFMMRLLTSSLAPSSVPSGTSFEFVPQSIAAFGSTVFVEGCDRTRSISWVHVWTIEDGIITQVREYFNTSLTVTCLGNKLAPSLTPSFSSASSSSSPENNPLHCTSVWKSSVSDQVGKSVPGLVLFV